MQDVDCPDQWSYDDHPRRDELLPPRRDALLERLYGSRIDTADTSADSRPVHGYMFGGLTPPHLPHFAGHYRGEDFPCLRDYEVHVRAVSPTDHWVGYVSENVPAVMTEFSDTVRGELRSLDQANGLPDAHLSQVDKLRYTVKFAARVFVQFLEVHPYADGNGHTARYIVWALLSRYRFWPKNWTIDPRPEPPYGELIRGYREGEQLPLERRILECVAET